MYCTLIGDVILIPAFPLPVTKSCLALFSTTLSSITLTGSEGVPHEFQENPDTFNFKSI